MENDALRSISKAEYVRLLQSESGYSPFALPNWFAYWDGIGNSRRTQYFQVHISNRIVPLALCEKKSGIPSQTIMECAPMNVFGTVSLNKTEMLEVEAELSNCFDSLLVSFTPDYTSDYLRNLKSPESYSTSALIFDNENDWKGKLTSAKRNSLKRHIKKSVSSGLSFRKGTVEDWTEIVSLYQKNLKRWGGKTRYAYNNNQLMGLAGLDDSFCQLWVVEKDGQIISGAVCFCSDRISINWLVVSDEDYFELRPNNLLFNEMLNFYQQEQFDLFDFGPSPGLDGVRRFKESFGARTIPYRRVEKLSPLLRTALKTKSLLTSFSSWLR